MIIDDQHQFVFIHIPKCAGTSIRKPLQSFDSRKGAFTNRVDDHPVLGRLDYVHIPLYTLREYFPQEFSAVRDYWSYAVVRDPFTRFASSVSQRLKMYSDQPIHKLSLDEIRAFIEESIDYLLGLPRDQHQLPPEYIHFQKQVDYINLEGERIVDTLYAVENINSLLADVGDKVGQNLLGNKGSEKSSVRANQTMVFRNDTLRRFIEVARPVTNRLRRALPESTKQQIRDRIYVPRDQRMRNLFGADDVRAFIVDYYMEDIACYQRVSRSEQRKAP